MAGRSDKCDVTLPFKSVNFSRPFNQKQRRNLNDEEKPVFVKYASESLTLWPMLYEKAWAKVFGNFKAIEGGTGYEAFKAIAQ
eukprot:6028654-Amphidinium_carterae.1